jgi:hypothetical protein
MKIKFSPQLAFLRAKNKKPPKAYTYPLEASYWLLLENPFHAFLQKANG